MESVFQKIAASAEVFFKYFDIDKLRTPTGHVPSNRDAIDHGGAKYLQVAKQQ
jgi:hypothetical protein